MLNNKMPMFRSLSVVLLTVVVAGCIPPVLPGQKVADPTFLPVETTFTNSVEITLDTMTDGASIRYTLDGSDPTAAKASVYKIYDGPFTLTATTSIKAAAYKKGMADSDIVSATYTKQVASHSLTITAASADGALVQNSIGDLSLTCTVEAVGATVQTVTADLTDLGGIDSQALALNGDKWTWANSILPVSQGPKTVRFTATDSLGMAAAGTANITVAPAIGAPVITNVQAIGSLVEDASAALTVSCAATAEGTTVQSVTADLTAFGLSDTEPLVANGDNWTWTGSVTPTSQGTKTITITATNAAAVTTEATVEIEVAAAPSTPEITAGDVTGALILGLSRSVTVECTVTIGSGSIATVTADLSAIGGSSAQALSLSGGKWSWTGNVTPPASGSQTISFAATGNGLSSDYDTTVNVLSTEPGTLSGTWTGPMVSDVVTKWGTLVFPADKQSLPTTLTFAANYQPETLPVCVGNSRQRVFLPTASLLNVNDEITADLSDTLTNKLLNLKAKVTQITRTSKTFTIAMDLTLTGNLTPWTGTYALSMTLGADEHVKWNNIEPARVSPSPYWYVGSGIIEDVYTSGDLVRQ